MLLSAAVKSEPVVQSNKTSIISVRVLMESPPVEHQKYPQRDIDVTPPEYPIHNSPVAVSVLIT
jgi:hypothetical protein